MILISLISGNRLRLPEWLGLAIAFSGFVYLVAPSLTTPSAKGFALMTIAGISWGIYTLRGKRSQNPLQDTGYNFIRAAPFAIPLMAYAFRDLSLSSEGVLLAIASGALHQDWDIQFGISL